MFIKDLKELDVVKLIKEFENIPAGTDGAIILDYDEEYCEVEFVDSNDNTIDAVSTLKELLELVWKYKD